MLAIILQKFAECCPNFAPASGASRAGVFGQIRRVAHGRRVPLLGVFLRLPRGVELGPVRGGGVARLAFLLLLALVPRLTV